MRMHRRQLTRALATSVAVLALAGVAVGCGESGSAGPYSGNAGELAKMTNEEKRAAYEQAMEQLRTRLDDPQAPPLERSIQLGQREELVSAAARWDEATVLASSVEPPDDIAVAHKDLVKAMQQLGDWNRRIAAATPNRKRVAALSRQAQASQAAKAFSSAVQRIEAKGYHVMTPPSGDAGGDPFAEASQPTG